MGFAQGAFWIFLAAVCVASLTFVTVAVWVGSRFQERQEFYRFELRKRMVESGKADSESFAALMRHKHELQLQKSREKVLTAAFVIAGVGVGICVGLQFIEGSVWMVGLIPTSLGLSMLAYGLLVAPRPKPEPPSKPGGGD